VTCGNAAASLTSHDNVRAVLLTARCDESRAAIARFYVANLMV
jgi:hypothetical protein